MRKYIAPFVASISLIVGAAAKGEEPQPNTNINRAAVESNIGAVLAKPEPDDLDSLIRNAKYLNQKDIDFLKSLSGYHAKVAGNVKRHNADPNSHHAELNPIDFPKIISQIEEINKAIQKLIDAKVLDQDTAIKLGNKFGYKKAAAAVKYHINKNDFSKTIIEVDIVLDAAKRDRTILILEWYLDKIKQGKEDLTDFIFDFLNKVLNFELENEGPILLELIDIEEALREYEGCGWQKPITIFPRTVTI